MPSAVAHTQRVQSRALTRSWEHLGRRAPAWWASGAFVIAGLIYAFWWRSHVDWGSPIRPVWNTSSDIWLTFQAAGQIAHGHLSASYQYRFVAFPGIAFLIAPIAAIASALNLTADVFPYTTQVYAHPQAWLLLGPYVLVITTLPLFAFDALAERLGADIRRRVMLACAQGVALWQVSVFFGHPEDAVAIGLMAYSYLFALDGRWNGAAWLFGFAVAFQPLVLATLPILLALSGVKRWSGFVVRAVVPPVIVVLGPLIAGFHVTVTALTQQPNYPTAPANHETPWTALAPRLHTGGFVVAAGPGRIVSLVLAIAVGWWSLRWRDRPELLVWAASFALALRCFTESVMDPYYLWPALALAMVASVGTREWRFLVTLAATVLITVTSQLHLSWSAWWALNMSELVVVLACAMPFRDAEASVPKAAPVREGRGKVAQRPPRPSGTGARKKPPPRRRKPASRR